MAEYIDIDAPIDVAVYQRNRRIQVTLRQILESNDAKYERAGVRPVVRARWEEFGEAKQKFYSCSNCFATHYRWDNYCPNCGADMREES